MLLLFFLHLNSDNDGLLHPARGQWAPKHIPLPKPLGRPPAMDQSFVKSPVRWNYSGVTCPARGRQGSWAIAGAEASHVAAEMCVYRPHWTGGGGGGKRPVLESARLHAAWCRRDTRTDRPSAWYHGGNPGRQFKKNTPPLLACRQYGPMECWWWALMGLAEGKRTLISVSQVLPLPGTLTYKRTNGVLLR